MENGQCSCYKLACVLSQDIYQLSTMTDFCSYWKVLHWYLSLHSPKHWVSRPGVSAASRRECFWQLVHLWVFELLRFVCYTLGWHQYKVMSYHYIRYWWKWTNWGLQIQPTVFSMYRLVSILHVQVSVYTPCAG